jgi:aldoxime dehydratase
MESAIPKHLETARSRHRRIGDDYSPPYPSFVARHKPAITNVVMAYFGLQYRGDPPAAATRLLADIAARFSDANGPSHWDRATYVDQAGFSNVVSVAYWDHVARFDAWFAPARGHGPGKAATASAASSKFCDRASRVTRRCFPHPTEPKALPFSPMA